RFQTIHHCSVDVARGLVLLFGIGTKALPTWESRTRWNNLLGGLIVRLMAGPSGQTNSAAKLVAIGITTDITNSRRHVHDLSSQPNWSNFTPGDQIILGLSI